MPPQLHVLDFLGQVFAAWHALPPLRNSRGVPTGAVYGATKWLLAYLAAEKPSHLVVVFDAGGNFRKELYPDYKGNRPPLDPDLKSQLDLARGVVRALPLPILSIRGWEADDVIATLTRQALAESWTVRIVSRDKDLTQLLRPGVTMYDAQKMRDIDAAQVQDTWGVRPDQMRDLLALCGDDGDNVPGVEGVGPGTAAAWLAKHETLEGVIEALPQMKKGKRTDALRAAHGNGTLALWRRLVTLVDEVPLPVGLADLAVPVRNEEVVTWLFTQLEFWSLLPSGMPDTPRGRPAEYDAQGKRE